MDRTLKQVKSTIEEHGLIPEGAHVVLGLSGGPDSVCLFDVLLKLRGEMGLKLHAVHVNHQLRGDDADRDQEYVEQLCIDNNVPLDVVVFDCKKAAEEQGVTTEEAGRIRRYQAFDDTAEKVALGLAGETRSLDAAAVKELSEQSSPLDPDGGSSREDATEMPDVVIAVAHNYDDQAETIMFRLMRGTGPDGLAGMEYDRTDARGFRLIRPLLDVKKEEVLEYCGEAGLEPRIDETNNEEIYSRNAIRLAVFPFLEKFSPNFRDALVRLGDIAREDKSFLRELAEEVFMYALKEMRMGDEEKKGGSITLDGDKLRKIAGPVRRRVISIAATRIGLAEDLTTKHFDQADSIIMEGGPSRGADLPHGYRISSVYGDVRISAPDENGKQIPPVNVSLMSKAEYDAMMERANGSDEAAELMEGRTAAFDADALELVFGSGSAGKVTWRLRESGDYILIKGGDAGKSMGGIRLTFAEKDNGAPHRKKIQDLFVDQKIPKEDRDKVYYAAVGREVLFIPVQEHIRSARYSESYRVTPGTARVIFLKTDPQ